MTDSFNYLTCKLVNLRTNLKLNSGIAGIPHKVINFITDFLFIFTILQTYPK